MKLRMKMESSQFWYDISGRHSLENWMEIQRLGTAFLRKFITALKGVLEQMGEYLLDTDGISLAPAYIFVDAKEENFGFCCMPFAKKTLEESLRSFMEYYLSHRSMETEKISRSAITYMKYVRWNYQDRRNVRDLI